MHVKLFTETENICGLGIMDISRVVKKDKEQILRQCITFSDVSAVCVYALWCGNWRPLCFMCWSFVNKSAAKKKEWIITGNCKMLPGSTHWRLKLALMP